MDWFIFASALALAGYVGYRIEQWRVIRRFRREMEKELKELE